MSGPQRKPAAALALSAAAIAGWLAFEGFRAAPYVPTQGDVPTIGFGSTHYEDGTRVTMADAPITRKRAEQLALGELDRTYAQCVRNSLGATPMHQVEFDQAADFAGQYGCAAWKASSMRSKTQAGDYPGACTAYLQYRYMTSARREGPGWQVSKRNAAGQPTRWRFDCATPGNKVCRGVWTRQLARHEACMAVQ